MCVNYSRMHERSPEIEEIVESVLAFARERLLREGLTIGASALESDLVETNTIQLGEEGSGLGAVLNHYIETLAANCIAADHPAYLSFIPAAPTKASTVFDMAVSASSIFGGFWQAGSGAIFAENQVISWLAREFGMPESAAGTFVQGGTVGNLSALVAAREHARRLYLDRGEQEPRRWVAVCNEEAHSSLTSAARVMDIDLIRVQPDDKGQMRGSDVRGVLEAQGTAVFAVVATAGSTNFGIIDDIASIAKLRSEFPFWLHVDGAYGLAGMLSPLVRTDFRGVEEADSVIVDPHKWLFGPLDACALIYRDGELGRAAHTQRASYLDTVTGSPEKSPTDYAIQLTRRVRGLPLWFSLAVHGAAAYRDAVTATVLRAREISEEIKKRPYLRLVREPQLSIVAFERVGWDGGQLAQWSERLLDRQQAFVRPSSYHGRPHLRFAIINPLTTFEQLAAILDTLSDSVEDSMVGAVPLSVSGAR